MKLLEAHELSVVRQGKTLLADASLSLEAGELTVVVGPNGAGKSTLLRVLAGELEPSHGHVHAFGRALSSWEPRVLAQKRAVVAQHVHVAFPWRIWDLVMLGRLPHDTSADDNHRSVAHALAKVDLAGFTNRLSHELSGGELARVHLARALAQLDGEGAAVLLLDEPTASLDPAHQHEILRLARGLAHAGHAVLCILHDLSLAAHYADRAVVLQSGKIVRQGPSDDVLTPELLADVFHIHSIRQSHAESARPSLFVLGPLPSRDPHTPPTHL